MASRQPLVSIITPSYNQAKYIAECIESVRRQSYPNIEHIVIDGGSEDSSVHTLLHYTAKWSSFRFISEKDRGQSHAINKGLAMAKGSIIGWLNSDDAYYPEAVAQAVQALQQHPKWGVVHGRGFNVTETWEVQAEYPSAAANSASLYRGNCILQPATFFRREVFDQVGTLSEKYNFCMDYDLWMRIAKKYPIGFVDSFWARARLHPGSKTSTMWHEVGLPEVLHSVYDNYGNVSKEWLQIFTSAHLNKDLFWFLHLFKACGILGNSPRTVSLNRFADHWVPPSVQTIVQVSKDSPLHYLLLRGKNPISEWFGHGPLTLTVKVNGTDAGQLVCPPGDFMVGLDIPIQYETCVIEIISHHHIVPSSMGINNDPRPLSFILENIVPLQPKESQFCHVYWFARKKMTNWLLANHDDTPRK